LKDTDIAEFLQTVLKNIEGLLNLKVFLCVFIENQQERSGDLRVSALCCEAVA
jgi:hypothetical protein